MKKNVLKKDASQLLRAAWNGDSKNILDLLFVVISYIHGGAVLF